MLKQVSGAVEAWGHKWGVERQLVARFGSGAENSASVRAVHLRVVEVNGVPRSALGRGDDDTIARAFSPVGEPTTGVGLCQEQGARPNAIPCGICVCPQLRPYYAECATAAGPQSAVIYVQ